MRLLLCSGGLDSIALMAVRAATGDSLAALFIDYGQLNAADEAASARHFCAQFDVALTEISMAGAFPPSGLSNDGEFAGFLPGKSRFFLPMRNAVFVSIAVSWAMRLGCCEILVGSVHADRTHLDSGPEYLARMGELVRLCSGGTVDFAAPFAAMRKAEVMGLAAEAIDPAELFEHTWSCYHPRSSAKVRQFDWGEGCGSCLSCRGRRAALGEQVSEEED